MYNPEFAEMFGAYFLPDLAGRQKEMDQIREALADPTPQPCVIFITGDGGIGKTRLLVESLQVARRSLAIVARKLVDLYHTHTHTAEGLAEAIYSALPDVEESFKSYERERKIVDDLRLSAQPLRELEQHRQNMLQAFTKGLRNLGQKQRVVIALDTLERLLYGAGASEPGPELDPEEVPQAWTWLRNILPVLRRVTIIMAGRPASKSLQLQLAALDGLKVVPLELGALTEEESLVYFEHAARFYRAQGTLREAQVIEWLDEGMRRLAHRLAEGRPILLALLVDYLATTGRIPDTLRTPPETVEPPKIRADLERELITRLTTIKDGDVIKFLGYLPKGCDAELLAKVMQIPYKEAQGHLQRAKSYSFVKVRPDDQRVFLHDEMYTLLSRHQLLHAPGTQPEAAKVEQGILKYYAEQLDQCRDEFARLYEPIEFQGDMLRDRKKLVALHIRRQMLLTELVYYRLRQNPLKGFQRYYRYNREATLSGDATLDAQLETEMRAFLAELDIDPQAKLVDGLELNQIEGILAMRPVVRAWTSENYTGLLERAAKLRVTRSDLLARNEGMTEAILSVWEAYALSFRGQEDDLYQARDRLNRVIEDLRRREPLYESAPESAHTWRARAIKAFAYRVRAYLNRVQGLMEMAVDDYREAAKLWRLVNIQIELAQTLNDMGFALAETGRFKDAHDLVQDALALRRRLGPRGPVGRSLNTLAHIHLRWSNYDKAQQYALQALRLYRALEYRRGEGLALTALAEAKRRKSGTADVPGPTGKVQLLREARDHAREAFEIFDELQERSRQVEALIEVGCAYRDWVKVRQAHPDPADDIERLASEGEKTLRRAAQLAGQTILYRQVDALVNLAWLGFFWGRLELVTEVSSQIKQVVPAGYFLDPSTGKPPIKREQAQVTLWPQLGKLQVLLGNCAFQRYERTGEIQELEEVGHKYTLGLAYNRLYGEDFRDMNRGKDEIYERVKRMHEPELRAVAAGVATAEREYHLGRSTMRELLEYRALWYGEQ